MYPVLMAASKVVWSGRDGHRWVCVCVGGGGRGVGTYSIAAPPPPPQLQFLAAHLLPTGYFVLGDLFCILDYCSC